MNSSRILFSWVLLLSWTTGGLLSAGGYTHTALKEACPKEVGDNLREALLGSGIRILDAKGKPWADVWLRKSVTTQADEGENGVDYGMLPEGSLLGVVRYHKKGADFRGDPFPAGVYTLRTALQPEDGEHLGASESRDFVIVCPAEGKVKLDPIPYKEAVKLSTKVSGAKHPSILYLVKLFTEAKPDENRFVEDEDLEYWVLDCHVADAAKGKKPVRLGIVLVGKALE